MKMSINDDADGKNAFLHSEMVDGAVPRVNGKSGGWSPVPQKDINNGKSQHQQNNHNHHHNNHHHHHQQNDAAVAEDSSDDDNEPHCGLGPWQPRWARVFESTHVFMVVFLIGWVLQGVFYTYLVSVITTIEKLFQIKSKTTGVLLAATEMGQICAALLLTYFAGRGHRPRWIACGMVMFALCTMGCALPHFIFGSKLLESSQVMHGINNNLSTPSLSGVCRSGVQRDDPLTKSAVCEDRIIEEQAIHSHMTNIVLTIYFMCLVGVGVGQTPISTLGIPYIDDNVASRESPLYIAITIGVKIIGPALGFILGSFCTRIYVKLKTPAGLGPTDPRWIGAWWLGMVMVSVTLFFIGLAMFCFPRQLPGSKAARAARAKAPKVPAPSPPQLKDFPKTLKKQISNDILMFRTASMVLHLLPVAGLYTFLPKYLESQFRLPTHDANLISGIGGILVMGVGILLSGAVILKFVPTARFVAGWIAFTALVYSAGMLLLIFIGCPMDDMVGLNKITPIHESQVMMPSEYSKIFTQPACVTECDCTRDKFSVICGRNGKTYFSACHAGCRNISLVNDTLIYFNCECIVPTNNSKSITEKNLELKYIESEASSGYCTGNCNNFILFICIFSFIMFTHATGEVGSILLIMRCTDPKDKSMAMGIIQFAIGLFGNVPCPIIFGIVVDSACLLWDSVCGAKGACFLYDSNVFRQFFLGTTAGIMALAFLADIVVWYKAARIDINPEGNVSEVISSKSVECIPKTVTLPQDLSTTPLTTPTIDTSV